MLLAGDIGGTKTQLAIFSLAEGPRRPVAEAIFPSADYTNLADMVREFITQTNLPVEYACFDVAGPVIGGRAQRREADSAGRIVTAEDRDGILRWRSDATSCYEGAEKVERDLVLVRPHHRTGRWGYVVVRDTVRLSGPQPVDFMLQPGGPVTTTTDEFMIQGKKARLLGKVLSPEQFSLSVLPGLGDRINVPDPLSLRISTQEAVSQVEFLVVLVPLAEGEPVPTATRLAHGLQVGSHVLRLDPPPFGR